MLRFVMRILCRSAAFRPALRPDRGSALQYVYYALRSLFPPYWGEKDDGIAILTAAQGARLNRRYDGGLPWT